MNDPNEDEPFAPLGQPADTPAREGTTTAMTDFADFRAMLQASPEEIAEHEAYIAARKQEERDRKAAVAQRDWELACPPRMQRYTLAHASLEPWRKHINRVMGWRFGSQGVFAVGGSGKGKSQSIYRLARRLAVEDLVTVRYLLQTQVTNEVNRNEMRAWLEKLDDLKRVPVLVWDDFGKFAAIGSRRDLLASEIEALVDYRFSHELPMLVSTNCRETDLIDVFGPLRASPILRRLTEGCMVVDFDKPL